MFATTSRDPVVEVVALSEPILNCAGGAPPGPIDTYMRMPTRFTRVTPPVTGADTSAQTTAYRSPEEASLGTSIVTVSTVFVRDAMRTTSWLTDVQLESSFRLRPGPRLKMLRCCVALAAYTETLALEGVSLVISIWRVTFAPGASRPTMYD
jgi:hypothetical protein